MTHNAKHIFSVSASFRNRCLTSFCTLIVLLMIIGTPAHAGKAWYPSEVDVWQPPFNDTRQRVQKLYQPLGKAQKKWRVSVFIPHLKDAFWMGVNYGLIDEARRLGVSVSLFEAGGYGQLAVQRRQIEEALTDQSRKTDGLIICAISPDGLNDLVKKARDQGIPVVDLINGISSPLISARAAIDYWDIGYLTGNYLRGIQEKKEKPINVAWFPGPSGPAWVAATDRGFRAAIEGNTIKILDTQHGDTGSAVQAKLVEGTLDQYADNLDVIVGTAVTAEVAVKILKKRRLSDRIKILSYYYSPGVHRLIRSGHIVAAPTDHQVIQARIALDVMVRILEKKDYFKHVAPMGMVVDRNNIKQWDSTTTLAPRGFRPIFSINE